MPNIFVTGNYTKTKGSTTSTLNVYKEPFENVVSTKPSTYEVHSASLVTSIPYQSTSTSPVTYPVKLSSEAAFNFLQTFDTNVDKETVKIPTLKDNGQTITDMISADCARMLHVYHNPLYATPQNLTDAIGTGDIHHKDYNKRKTVDGATIYYRAAQPVVMNLNQSAKSIFENGWKYTYKDNNGFTLSSTNGQTSNFFLLIGPGEAGRYDRVQPSTDPYPSYYSGASGCTALLYIRVLNPNANFEFLSATPGSPGGYGYTGGEGTVSVISTVASTPTIVSFNYNNNLYEIRLGKGDTDNTGVYLYINGTYNKIFNYSVTTGTTPYNMNVTPSRIIYDDNLIVTMVWSIGGNNLMPTTPTNSCQLVGRNVTVPNCAESTWRETPYLPYTNLKYQYSSLPSDEQQLYIDSIPYDRQFYTVMIPTGFETVNLGGLRMPYICKGEGLISLDHSLEITPSLSTYPGRAPLVLDATFRGSSNVPFGMGGHAGMGISGIAVNQGTVYYKEVPGSGTGGAVLTF